MKVGLVVHPGRPASVEAGARAAATLAGTGAEVRTVRDAGSDQQGLDIDAVEPATFAHGLDLVLSLGGDGTFLRAAHLCRDVGVPVLGVNLGRLGFLAGLEDDELDRMLPLVANGEFEVEERPTLQVQLDSGDGGVVQDWALNEVSIEKTARQRLLIMDVYVGESLYARIPADALVVATPTGSTAYGFSAGGPIISPHVDATLVIPVAPHSVFGRALVVGADEVIRVRVLEDQAPAVASCDGRSPHSVPEGGWVAAVGQGPPVRIARTGDGDFYSLVRRKFGLR